MFGSAVLCSLAIKTSNFSDSGMHDQTHGNGPDLRRVAEALLHCAPAEWRPGMGRVGKTQSEARGIDEQLKQAYMRCIELAASSQSRISKFAASGATSEAPFAMEVDWRPGDTEKIQKLSGSPTAQAEARAYVIFKHHSTHDDENAQEKYGGWTSRCLKSCVYPNVQNHCRKKASRGMRRYTCKKCEGAEKSSPLLSHCFCAADVCRKIKVVFFCKRQLSLQNKWPNSSSLKAF